MKSNSGLYLYHVKRKGQLGGLMWCDVASKDEEALKQFKKLYGQAGELVEVLAVGGVQ